MFSDSHGSLARENYSGMSDNLRFIDHRVSTDAKGTNLNRVAVCALDILNNTRTVLIEKVLSRAKITIIPSLRSKSPALVVRQSTPPELFAFNFLI